MKRIMTLIVFALILAMINSIAGAEVLYQKNFFEMALPDGWYYNESRDRYDCKRNNARVFLSVTKEETAGSSDTDAIVAEMLANIGTDSAHSSWEKIVVDGQDTILITFVMDEGNTCYATAIRNSDSACYAIYSSNNPDDGKMEFLDLIQRFYVRPEKDASYFRYGNADVKLKNYRTRTVNGKMYLLVDFTWRNIGTKEDIFVINVDVKAYQDGIELHDGYLFDIYTETGTSIMPGKELTVTEIFQLRSKTGKITLILDKLLDVTHEWPSRRYEYTLK